MEFLASVAGAGPILELAIGTGRVALPLAERGFEVHGIDASTAMVQKLRGKPGGTSIPVAIGDFADVEVEGSFSLVYVVFNTFFALPSQEAQVRCFQNVAERLSAGGVFVIEAFVPDLSRFDRDQRVSATSVEPDRVQLEVSSHDLAAQRVESLHVQIEEGSTRLFPVHIRYAWPSELDLMARLAGLELRERYADFNRQAFSAAADVHVSVYGRP